MFCSSRVWTYEITIRLKTTQEFTAALNIGELGKNGVGNYCRAATFGLQSVASSGASKHWHRSS
ncbi:MAG: hypothetical protein ABJB97_08985, partial [Acidobacteriota bacterium]